MRDSFVFYRSFYEAIDALPEDKQLKLFKMICELGLNNLETTEQDKIVKALFALIEPQIKANNRRYENGKKGGAPKGNINAKKQPNINQKLTEKQPKMNRKLTEKQPNVNVNDNVNDNVNVNDNDKYIYFQNQDLENIFNEFLQIRKKLKAINSERAINMLINKLSKYDDKTKYAMIEQSIVHSWKDIYELKEVKQANVPAWMNEERKEKELTDEQKRILAELKGSN